MERRKEKTAPAPGLSTDDEADLIAPLEGRTREWT
jgi:hypothetical protein